MSPGLNWLLIIAGAILILVEILMGAATGFDFLLIGSAILLGGALGLLAHSAPAGLAAAGVLSLLYVLAGRRRIRGRLLRPNIPSNVDALIGRTAQVVQEIGLHQPGRVKLEGEEWRALPDLGGSRGAEGPAGPPLAAGSDVLITHVDGVTLYVRPAGSGPGKERP